MGAAVSAKYQPVPSSARVGGCRGQVLGPISEVGPTMRSSFCCFDGPRPLSQPFLLCLSVCCPEPSVTEAGSAAASGTAGSLCRRGPAAAARSPGRAARRCCGWNRPGARGRSHLLSVSQGRDGRDVNRVTALWNGEPLFSLPFHFSLFLQGK